MLVCMNNVQSLCCVIFLYYHPEALNWLPVIKIVGRTGMYKKKSGGFYDVNEMEISVYTETYRDHIYVIYKEKVKIYSLFLKNVAVLLLLILLADSSPPPSFKAFISKKNDQNILIFKLEV